MAKSDFFSMAASLPLVGNDWTKEHLVYWVSPDEWDWRFSRECICSKDKVEVGIVHSVDEILDAIKKGDEDAIVKLLDEKGNWGNFSVIAKYFPLLPRTIKYYESFYTASDDEKAIYIIHERMHAFHHCNKDGIWEGFYNVSPVYLEFLAQLFTFHCVKETKYEPVFKDISKGQPLIYQTWEIFKDIEPLSAYSELKQTFKLRTIAPAIDTLERAYTKQLRKAEKARDIQYQYFDHKVKGSNDLLREIENNLFSNWGLHKDRGWIAGKKFGI